MKIAFVHLWDPHNVFVKMRSSHYKAKCLEDHSLELTYIGPFKEKYQRYFTVKQKMYTLFKRNYERWREPVTLRGYADQIQDKLSRLDVDIVFSDSSIPVSLLKCRQPIVFWVDATFAGMVDFYPEFSNLSQESLRKGNAQEQAALRRCSLAIYASEWGAETARKNYQVDQQKIKVVPFGANFLCNRTQEDISGFLQRKSADQCKLLFFGIDWNRKGGNVALSVTKELNNKGLKTELTTIGCEPQLVGPLPDFVKAYGFIDKTSQAGIDKINQILSETHFLIHPARAETFGCVFCEANSFGVPCLASDVGGIPTAIRDNMNGKLFPQRDNIGLYCDFIMNTLADFEGYKNLARSSFQEYQTRLNWDVAGKTVKKMLRELI
jgi:glycosyltransferase involved in cell wall biosynthesis